MTYFPVATKESNIKKFFAICSDGLKLEPADKRSSEYGTRNNLVKIMVDLLSEEEVKSLLKLAETYDSWKDEILADNSLSSKEGFLKHFYRDIFPMIIKKDFFLEIVREINVSIPTKVNYDIVRAKLRADFLRYFISWEKPVQPSFSSECLFEAFNNDCSDKINNFKFGNISEMYLFAATVIRYSSMMPKFLLDVSIGLFHNIDFLKVALDRVALDREMFNPRDYFDALNEFAEKEDVITVVGFSRLDADVRKKIAEILFTSEAVKKVFDDYVNWYSRRKFYDIMVALDPEYEMKIVKMIFEKEAKVLNVEFKYYIDFFVGRCHDFRYQISLYKFPRFSDGKNSDEFKRLILETFLNEKVFKTECYKKMPKFLQHIAVIEQVMSIYGKAEVLSETKIDKEELNKEVNLFFEELKRIAKKGGKPSDYCCDKPREFYYYDNSYELWYMGNSYKFRYNGLYNPSQDSKQVYVTSLVFHTAVSFLQDSCEIWKAVKPMLTIFRNLKEQALSSIEMKREDYGCYPWDFVSFRLTQILGSLDKNETEAENVSLEWLNHLAKQLKSADEIEVKKREENPETVPEKFKAGYDINVIEPHPLWRETYCKAAEDLGVNLGVQNSVFNYRKKEDKDESVREAAAETLNSIEKIKGKFDSSSRKRALLNAWWWHRIAHFISLGVNFDYDDAWEIKLREVKTNYSKYFDAPKPVVKKSQS